jgi:uncharacterized protein YbjT (DUF2867 family)
VRDPEHVRGRRGWEGAEIRQGDALVPLSLLPVMEGVEVAYYLIHSMSASKGHFEDHDRVAAERFGLSANAAGVRRIIYLGGLGHPDDQLSPHLASRHEVGDILRSTGVPVTEFRAAVIVGSGSVSFEMIRYVTEGVPVMFTPRWMSSRCQPISIRNVLDYLTQALGEPRSVGKVFEIGGPDVLTYGEMIQGYAAERQLRRILIPLPVVTPRLSALWLHLLTPIHASIARTLIEGMRNDVVVGNHAATDVFRVELIPYREAVRRALHRMQSGSVETFWSGARPRQESGVTLTFAEGMMVEERRLDTKASTAAVFATFTGIGGERGWFYADWGWQLRGLLDRLVGGVGLRRGRRNPDHVRLGDALDFWRVEALEPGQLMRLRAEMKLPGRGWLQFEAIPHPKGGTVFELAAFFEPHGLLGLVYWYALYPLHRPFFSGLSRQIVRRAERLEAELVHSA